MSEFYPIPTYGRFKNLTGLRFGRLVVLGYKGPNGRNKDWLCQCDCGKRHTTTASRMQSGMCTSCGCYRTERYNALVNDLTGKRHGRLVVIRRAENKGDSLMWECRCDCGKTRAMLGKSLKANDTFSCGCLHDQMAGNRTRTHGRSGPSDRTYSTWRAMISRATNPRSPGHERYFDRGITMCRPWRESFERFLADMGERPAGTSLDRIDNNGNYEPGNCRWADAKTQMRNTRNNRLVTYRGETRCVSEWAEITGIKLNTLFRRIRLGMSGDGLFHQPSQRPPGFEQTTQKHS